MLYQIDIKQNYGWWTFLGKKIEETICIEIELVKYFVLKSDSNYFVSLIW